MMTRNGTSRYFKVCTNRSSCLLLLTVPGYLDDEVEPNSLEETYTKAHKAIRGDPWKKEISSAGPKKSKEE